MVLLEGHFDMAKKEIYGKELFSKPARLRAMIDEYFASIDELPPVTVAVGKNLYTRKVPYTVEGLCAYLCVQKGDVKQMLEDPGSNAQCRQLMVKTITRIEALLTEKALTGELDATVSKIVLSGSLLQNGTDVEIDGKNGFAITIKGMTPDQLEAARR